MLVKDQVIDTNVANLEETITIIKNIQMPSKYAFGYDFGKSQRFMIHSWDVDVHHLFAVYEMWM